MNDNLTERARKAKELAAAQARWLHKKAISAEDLLYGLLQSGPNLATAIVNKLNIFGTLTEELGEAPEQQHIDLTADAPDWDESCRRILDRATAEAKELGHKFIGTEHLFLGLISEKAGKVSDLLHKAGVEYASVRKELLDFIGVTEKEPEESEEPEPGTVEVQIKQRGDCRDLPLPRYMSEAASGMDLYAAVEEETVLEPGGIMLVPTGLSIAVPRGYEAQVRPRSGLALKHGITIVNSPGTIDSDYRGEVGVILANIGSKPFVITRGMRIAQVVIQAVVRAKVVPADELEETGRGAGGFGSSGV